MLVSGGQVRQIKLPTSPDPLPFRFRSMRERHPRSAIGWNAGQFFLIQVDGRQEHLSAGMTLEELGAFARDRLGCTHVMNLDGGVSSTLWADGRVRNRPCDAGREHDIANAVVVVRRRASQNAR
jgi:exopolysaccharide biosynthesis protein